MNLSTFSKSVRAGKVVEEIGEKKEKVIREKIAQDRVDKNPVSSSEFVVVGSGDVLFMEPICGKPFKSDNEYVRKVINDFNYRMTTGREEYIPLSEFFSYIFNYERRIR
jgi:hypothetical protein